VTNGKVKVESIEDFVKKLPTYLAIKPTMEPYWDPLTDLQSKVYEANNNGWTIANPPNSKWTAADDVIVMPTKKYLQL
jgi:hypothetical protein